jgi:hypothetical protein
MDELKNIIDSSLEAHPTSKLKPLDEITSDTGEFKTRKLTPPGDNFSTSNTFKTQKLQPPDGRIPDDTSFNTRPLKSLSMLSQADKTTVPSQQSISRESVAAFVVTPKEKKPIPVAAIVFVTMIIGSILFLYILSQNITKKQPLANQTDMNISSSGAAAATGQGHGGGNNTTGFTGYSGYDNSGNPQNNENHAEGIAVYDGIPSLVYTPTPVPRTRNTPSKEVPPPQSLLDYLEEVKERSNDPNIDFLED